MGPICVIRDPLICADSRPVLHSPSGKSGRVACPWRPVKPSLGKYTIHAHLGKGAFAHAWLLEDLLAGRLRLEGRVFT